MHMNYENHKSALAGSRLFPVVSNRSVLFTMWEEEYNIFSIVNGRIPIHNACR